MKRFSLLLILSLFIVSSIHAQKPGTFYRADTISVPTVPGVSYDSTADWGNLVAGLDLDKDGKYEIYAVNNNNDDFANELVPKLYKYEYQNKKWVQVWMTNLDIPAQNTWPALNYGDLDKDGKTEIIWGPTNFIDRVPGENPNPTRIAVFEARGDGSEGLGVDFFGSTIPNAKWTMTTADKQQIRPITWFVTDIDNDGKNELVYADYAGTSGQSTGFGVVSVDKIPDNADGSEKWSFKINGKDPSMTIVNAAKGKYDIVQLNNVLYLFESTSSSLSVTTTNIYPIKFANNTWTALPPQTNLGPSSWKSAQVVDIDKDGKKEIVYGGWTTGKVYLLQQQGDTLVSKQIANFGQSGNFMINGGASGDIDGDGKIDFVFGTRAGTPASQKPVDAILRLQYLGGAITDSNSYKMSIIDSLIHSTTGQMDVIRIADVYGDGKQEVVYTSGYGRGPIDLPKIPIVILKYQPVSSVEREKGTAPESFYLSQNYPNPFNPSTSIKFGLTEESVVSLKVFNALGQQVATLINNEKMDAGSFNVTYNASDMASGTYIYQLNIGNTVISKKMLLMK